MTPEWIRSHKMGLVVTLNSVDEVLEHPMVKTTKNGDVIAIMAVNTALEQLARKAESAPITHAEDES